MRHFRTFLAVISIFFPFHQMAAQVSRDSIVAYNWFDGIVGIENTDLFNGVEYIEQHVMINEKQKYFRSVLFLPGSVVYDGQRYFDVEMKYNVYDDLLLLKGIGEKPMQLHKDLVTEFSLEGHSFINIQADGSDVEGFYELLLEEEQLRLLKKHTKKPQKFLDKSFTYYEFHDDTSRYAVYYREDYFPVNNRRQVLRAFPDHSGEIRRFYRRNQSLAKSKPDAFMTGLFKELSRLSSYPNNSNR